MNPAHTITPYLFNVHFFQLRLGLPSGLFPSGFSTQILPAFSSPPFVLLALLGIEANKRGDTRRQTEVIPDYEDKCVVNL
jgi:hypothetical protein